MVEVNRNLYLKTSSAGPGADFARIAAAVQRCCVEAIDSVRGVRSRGNYHLTPIDSN